MTDDRLKRCVQRLTVAIQAHTRSLEEMDEAAANRHAAIMSRLLASIMADPAGPEVLVSLMGHASPEVRGMAALHLLPLQTDRALEVLRELASLPGLMGFRASVALERWEQGDLERGGRHGA